LFSLFHRLIPVSIFSLKVPLAWRVLIEGIKVLPSEAPSPADELAFKLPTADILPHSTRVKAENFGRFPNCQKVLSDRDGFALFSQPFPSLLFHRNQSTKLAARTWAQLGRKTAGEIA
jgi:hypothetical protein